MRSQWVEWVVMGRMGRVGKRGQHLTARPYKALGSDNADQRTDSAKRSAASTQPNARPITHPTHNYPHYP